MGKRGRGRKFGGSEGNKKNEGGEEYKVVGNFIHPWFQAVYRSYRCTDTNYTRFSGLPLDNSELGIPVKKV